MFDSAFVACEKFLRYVVRYFLTKEDREFEPVNQELAAIEAFLHVKRGH